jgi:hypothetical protein
MKHLVAVALLLVAIFLNPTPAKAVDMIYFEDWWFNPYMSWTDTFDEATEATEPVVPFMLYWGADMLISVSINGQTVITRGFNLIDPDGSVSDSIQVVQDPEFPWSTDVLLYRVVTNPDLSLPSILEDGSWIPFTFVYPDGSWPGINCAIYSGPDVPNNSVPEPSSFFLLGVGIAGLGLLRRRFKT